MIGPGRWGTTNPQLGVPVSYSEISNAEVIIEVSTGKFAPELSYGTHFLGDLLAGQIFYISVFPEREDVFDNKWLFEKTKTERNGVILIELDKDISCIVDGRNQNGVIFEES